MAAPLGSPRTKLNDPGVKSNLFDTPQGRKGGTAQRLPQRPHPPGSIYDGTGFGQADQYVAYGMDPLTGFDIYIGPDGKKYRKNPDGSYVANEATPEPVTPGEPVMPTADPNAVPVDLGDFSNPENVPAWAMDGGAGSAVWAGFTKQFVKAGSTALPFVPANNRADFIEQVRSYNKMIERSDRERTAVEAARRAEQSQQAETARNQLLEIMKERYAPGGAMYRPGMVQPIRT